MESQVKFEVQVSTEGRWSIMTDAPTKLRAIDEAKNLLGSGKYQGVKVTEERGQSREIVVWQQEASPTGEVATSVVPIDEAPICTRREHFYRYSARKAAGRLLRKHLDNIGLTAFELVHDAGKLREFQFNEKLFVQAIQFVGNLQSKGTKHKPHDRVDFLEKSIGELIARPEELKIDGDSVGILKKAGLAKLFENVRGGVAKADLNFVVRCGVAEYLGAHSDWEGKLVLLLDLAEKDTDEDSDELIDEIVAEILDGSEAVQEILGYQKNLGKALQVLVQVGAGTFRIQKGSGSSVERLTQLMARKAMPNTRGVIADRLVKELSGINKLTKSDQIKDEQEAFVELLLDVFRGRIPARASEICEAATLRAKSLFKDEYGDESFEKAIDDVIAVLPTEAAKFNYLLDLTNSALGEKMQEHVIDRLSHVVDGMRQVTDLVGVRAGQVDLVRTAAALRDRLLQTKLPEEWRNRFAKKIYDLLMESQGGKPAAAPAGAPKAPAAKGNGKAPEGDTLLGRQTLEVGTVLFNEGEAGDMAYLVIAGEVEIYREADGQIQTIATAGPGSIVGEMALIDSSPRMASARASAETQVTIIPQKDLKARLDRLEKVDPVMRRLVGMFVQRLRDFPIIENVRDA